MDRPPTDSGDSGAGYQTPWDAPPPGSPPRPPGDQAFSTFVILAGAVIVLLLVFLGIRALQLQSQLQQTAPTIESSPAATATTFVVDAPLTRTAPIGPAAPPTLAPQPTGGTTEDIVRRTMRSVVRVEAGDSEGTAFMFRQRGTDALFVTNAHVVEGTSTVTLVTRDGISYPGVVLARDPQVDLAIVDVRKLTDIPALPIGDSSLVKVGDQLYVIGYPLGSELEGDASVTRGIISGQRTVKDITYLQTDAATNPGNSGGPVIDAVGQVIGVATWRIGDLDVQGISFAIPSKLMVSTVESLLASNPNVNTAGSDVWLKISAEEAVRGRGGHAAAWTGTEMIVWGGLTSGGATRTGARYDPSKRTWKPISTQGAPSARLYPSTVWTGKEMIVWGGTRAFNADSFLADGARYNPATDTWTPISKSPLSPRIGADAVWTGKEMIIWGGMGGSIAKPTFLGDGARYNPTTDRWSMLPTQHEPSPRYGEAGGWTGKELIIWGGRRLGANGELGDGARYNPATNTWTALPATNVLSPRWGASAVWTGKYMIFWGGEARTRFFNDGALYNPESNAWTPIPETGAPTGRFSHSAVWTGSEMLIWGGLGADGGFLTTGARYSPSTEKWLPLPLTPLDRRIDYTYLWTGNAMIIWGGYYFEGNRDSAAISFFGDGAIYYPAAG